MPLPWSRPRRAHTPAVLVAGGAIAAAALLAHVLRRALAPRFEQRQSRERANAGAPRAPDNNGFDLQAEHTGVGVLTHRRFAVNVPRASFTTRSLLQEIQRSMQELSPASLASFEKAAGEAAWMAVGDEYDVTMLGPWNGRVRVAEVLDDCFTLVTLHGHPEAGHITFSVVDLPHAPDRFDVVIESWARVRDRTVQVAYETLTVGRSVQTEVWVTFLQRVAERTGCTEVPEVDIRSEELTE